MDPRGTTAKRQKWQVGPLLAASKHHLDLSNFGQENEWVLLVPAQ
jgi:hypothetical protein